MFLPEMWQKGSYSRALLDKEERSGEGASEALGENHHSRNSHKRLFILRDQSFLESFVYSGGSIQTIRADALLSCLGSGKYGDWLDIRVCNDAVKNIYSAGLQRDMGYGLQLLRVPRVVRLIDGE